MAQVLVRGLDDRVVARMKAIARANGRSLEAELRSVVEQAAARDERMEATRELAARLRRRLAAEAGSTATARHWSPRTDGVDPGCRGRLRDREVVRPRDPCRTRGRAPGRPVRAPGPGPHPPGEHEHHLEEGGPRELTADEGRQIVAALRDAPVEITASAGLIAPAYEIAGRTGRTVYDALYVALAVARDCLFVTGDARLAAALAGGPLGSHVRTIDAWDAPPAQST